MGGRNQCRRCYNSSGRRESLVVTTTLGGILLVGQNMNFRLDYSCQEKQRASQFLHCRIIGCSWCAFSLCMVGINLDTVDPSFLRTILHHHYHVQCATRQYQRRQQSGNTCLYTKLFDKTHSSEHKYRFEKAETARDQDENGNDNDDDDDVMSNESHSIVQHSIKCRGIVLCDLNNDNDWLHMYTTCTRQE
jgi:hypothetical protein